jgi:hypothetical protein
MRIVPWRSCGSRMAAEELEIEESGMRKALKPGKPRVEI